MGRPPIGKETMTATERQRRWRQQKRLAQASENEATAPAAETQFAVDHRLIEALKAQLEERTAQLEERTEEWEQACRERDDAYRDRDEAHRERDEARKGIIPKFKRAEDQIRESWCMFCRRGQAQVDIIVATDVELRLGICFNCIERCNKIVAEKRAVSRV